MPRNWTTIVNSVMTRRELDRIEQSLARGVPLGEPTWVEQTIKRLGLQHTIRAEGRPRRKESL